MNSQEEHLVHKKDGTKGGKKKLFHNDLWEEKLSLCTRDLGFPGGSVVKNPSAIAGDTGDMGSIPGSGRFPGGGSGNAL